MATVLEDKRPRGRPRIGRPPKFTPEFEAAFLEGIRAGVPEVQLLARHHVSDGALRKWLRDGQGGDPRFRDFVARYRAARARAERARLLFRVRRRGLVVTVEKRRPYPGPAPLPDAVLPHAKKGEVPS